MLAVLFFLSIFIIGFLVNNYFFPKQPVGIKFAGAFLLGSLISVTLIYTLLALIRDLPTSLIVYFGASISIFFYSIFKQNIWRTEFKKKYCLVLPLIGLIYYFFNKSFSYDNASKGFLISSNTYMDFGAHIPFARFLTSGGNSSFEVPFYAGKNFIYHYFFDFYVGILEFLGMRIDLAFNIISVLSLFFLLVVIYELAYLLFKNRYVGLLSSLLIIFNSDLSFIQVFKKYGLSIVGLYNHNEYFMRELWGVVIKGNFLNINVYLNQRHLIFALLWFFLIIYFILKNNLHKKSIFFIAIIVGIFPFWHVPALISLYIVLFVMIVLLKDKRKQLILILFISLLLAIPQFYSIKVNSLNTIEFYPGFITHDIFSVKNFVVFWMWNLGISIPLLVFGFMKSNWQQRKIFISFFVLFVFANLFKFSRDAFDNHKFFNVWIILANIYTGWGLVQLYKKNTESKILSTIFVFLLIISGFFHLLVVKNDVRAIVPDYRSSNLARWAQERIPKSSLIFTNGDIYDPLSISGRRTFLGRSHYIYQYGGDPSKRIGQRQKVLLGKNYNEVKNILYENSIQYVVIYKKEFIINRYPANLSFFDKYFNKIYENNQGIIYKI